MSCPMSNDTRKKNTQHSTMPASHGLQHDRGFKNVWCMICPLSLCHNQIEIDFFVGIFELQGGL